MEDKVTLEDKLKVLSLIGEELNHASVTWALGASMLLYVKGIVEEFNDIDIMVAEKDAEITKKILSELGKMYPQKQNAGFHSKEFWQFHVGGVDVDVIAGFVIIKDGQEYYFPLKGCGIVEYAMINNVKIPLQSIEEWRNYYYLMGREQKVKLIDLAENVLSFQK